MANIRGIELASEIYDLEDTSARNTATAASQTATQAEQTATAASQTATTASQTATTASQTATTASETATAASQTATAASQTATTASETATAASQTATTASQTATRAEQTATAASQTATAASQTATTASQTATAASQAAEEANEKIGNLANLETTAKTNLVSAINEVATKETPVIFTCGYYQVQISANGRNTLRETQISVLIGKSLTSLTVGQGVLLQGIAKRANATEGIPFSVSLLRTASGFTHYDAVDGTGISITVMEAYGNVSFSNTENSAVTLYLNVAGLNTSIIYE